MRIGAAAVMVSEIIMIALDRTHVRVRGKIRHNDHARTNKMKKIKIRSCVLSMCVCV